MPEKASDRAGTGAGGTSTSNDPTERFHAELDKLRAEIARLREDMREAMSDAVGVGRQGVEAAKARAADELDERMRQLEQAYARARAQGSRAVDTLEKQIEERPLVVVAAALAAGAVLGRLLMGPKEK